MIDPDVLPILIENPIRHRSDALYLALPGREPMVLRDDRNPIATFNPGWTATGLFTLLDPLWVLVLRHELQGSACWYLTRDGIVAAAPRDRPAEEREPLARRLRQVALWLRAAAGAPIRLPAPPAVLAVLGLPEPVRRELEVLLDEPLPSAADAEAWLGRLSSPTPPLAFEPIAGTRRYRVGHRGAMVPMLDGEVPAELQPGWEVSSLEAPFAPVLTVNLRHADGVEAAWFIGLDGRVLGHHVAALPPELARHVVTIVAPLFDGMWRSVVLGEAAVADLVDDARVRALIGDMPFRDLAGLLPLYSERQDAGAASRVWSLDEPPPAGLGYVVPTAHGLRVFDQVAMARTVRHALHGEMERLVSCGRMMWPSPLDGSLVESDGFALLLEHNCFAYRFRQQATGLVFLVVCTGTHFYNHAIYFPTADLLVALSHTHVEACRPYFVQARSVLLHHLTTHREALVEGSRIGPDPTVQQFFGDCRVHIGHYVWQDLAGLTFLHRAMVDLPTARLPWLRIFNCRRTQAFFGPEERIFPRLAGRMTRHDDHFRDGIGAFYRRGQRVIKYTAISVPAELRGLVWAAAEATPEIQAELRDADDARHRSSAVILLGIRIGDRTMTDMASFAHDLLDELARSFPGCTLVLDGMNDDADRGIAAWPDVPAGSVLDQEFAIARSLEMQGAELGVRVVSTVNRSALHSVTWCARADCFIAPLGAALAKYRWICNTPGLVLTSRWNLQHRTDLRIYDAPAALEGSSEMLFNGVDDVGDLMPEDDAGNAAGRGNFTVERAPVFALFTDLVRRHASARQAGLPSSSVPVGRRVGQWQPRQP